MNEHFKDYSASAFDDISFSALTSLRQCLLQRGLYVPNNQHRTPASAIHKSIKKYRPWPEDVDRPQHNPKYCPTGPFIKNFVPHLPPIGSSSLNNDKRNISQVERQQKGTEEQSGGDVNIQRDAFGNINVTTPQHTREPQRREGGLRQGFFPWGAGSPVTPTNDIRKLKQVENMGKAYANESAKFGGHRDEDFGSALLTFQRNLKLYRVDEEQWVSVFPLMLKKRALRFYEDHM